MANLIDIIILLLFIYYFFRGWEKGFIRSLWGPLALIMGCCLSYAYFQRTQNIMISVAISLISPIFLHLLLIGYSKLYCMVPDKKTPPTTASRFVGGAFSLGWSGGFLVLILFMIMVTSSIIPQVANAKQGLAQTKTYRVINHFVGNVDFAGHQAQFENLSNTVEFQALMADETFRAFASDPEIQQNIKDGNIAALIKDPRMQNMFSSKEMIGNLFDLQKKMIEENMTLEVPENQFKGLPGGSPNQNNYTPKPKSKTPTPRIINIEPSE